MPLLGAVACSPSGNDAPAGSRFVVRGTSVARDAQTGLEWTRHDDGAGLDWVSADAYCRSLSIDDVRGWRLPEAAELARLYGGPAKTPCGEALCRVDPVFTLTSPYVWTASAPQGPNARTYVDLQYGTQLTPSISPRLVRRVLCVRTPAGS